MKLLPIFIPLSWARTLVTTCMYTFNLFIKCLIKSCTVHYFSDIVALFVHTAKLRESVLACIKRSCLYHACCINFIWCDAVHVRVLYKSRIRHCMIKSDSGV